MNKQYVRFWRDPFCVDVPDGAMRLFVDPPTGDILMGSVMLLAWKGLAFSLVEIETGSFLKLQYRDIGIDVGWIIDAVDASKWVEEVNRFLALKKKEAATNGKVGLPELAGSEATGGS